MGRDSFFNKEIYISFYDLLTIRSTLLVDYSDLINAKVLLTTMVGSSIPARSWYFHVSFVSFFVFMDLPTIMSGNAHKVIVSGWKLIPHYYLEVVFHKKNINRLLVSVKFSSPWKSYFTISSIKLSLLWLEINILYCLDKSKRFTLTNSQIWQSTLHSILV